MMTRLAKPPDTREHPYALVENVSDGNYLFFKYSSTKLFAFACCVPNTRRNSVQDRVHCIKTNR